MKKLLGILFFSLLLSWNGYSIEINSSTTTPITNDDVTITSSGSITTTSNPSISVSNSVNDGKIIDNAGTITTSGFRNQGIWFYLSGSHDVTNSGTISTSGERAQAIRLTTDSDNNTVTNSGTLSTTGDEADGVKFYLGDNNTFTSNSTGTITTSGDDAHGIDIEGSSNNTITNQGSIISTGTASHGINMINGTDFDATQTINNTITNSGSINVSGSGSNGISINVDNNTITNSGTITTSGNSSIGINLLGGSNTLCHTGTITNSGTNSIGLSITGSNNTLSCSGDFLTSGDSAKSIYINSNGYTYNNTEIITVTGDGSKGIDIESDNNIITNSGSIISTGNNSPAIYVNNADNNTITNSGTITVSGSNPYAIHLTGSSSSNNFIINNTNIVGEIFSDSSAVNTLTNNNDFGNSSYFISTTGNWNIINNTSSELIPNSNGSQLAVGKFKNSSELMFQRIRGLNDFIAKQNSQNLNNELPKIGIYYQDTNRNSKITYNDLDNYRYGFNIIKPTNNDKIKILLNIEQAETILDNSEFKDKEASILVGLSFPNFHNIGSTRVNYKGLVGKTYHDTSRKIYTNKNVGNNSSGLALIDQKYKSYHLNLGGSTFTSLKKTDTSDIGLTLGVDFNTNQNEKYSDVFFQYDKSTLSQLESLIELMYQSQINKNLSLSTNINTKTRKIISGTSQSYKLKEISKSFSSDKSDIYFGGTLNLKYRPSNKMVVDLSLNLQDSSDNVSSFGGGVSINYKF